MTDQEARILELLHKELSVRRPETQQQVCTIAAKCTIAIIGVPCEDKDFINFAWQMATGLFGPAFDKANEGQRWDWIDMCERALREEAEGLNNENPLVS